MKFYTNFSVLKNHILVRGYDNGKQFKEKVPYKPYLFVPSQNKYSKFKTLEDNYVDKIQFDSITEARDFVKQYEDVENFKIYGLTNYQYVYIYDNYKGEIKFDTNLIRVGNIDIEVEMKGGINNAAIQNAKDPITVITLRHNKISWVFALPPSHWFGKYYPSRETQKDVIYKEFRSEIELLEAFLDKFNELGIDVITGWNCVSTYTNIWLENEIKKIKNIDNIDLYDNVKIKNISPVSNKKKYILRLSSGQKIECSKDHKFFVYTKHKEQYTDLKNLNKEIKTLDEIINMDKNLDVYIDVPLRKNNNPDNIKYSNDELYLAGLIYTDGTLKSSNDISQGFTIFQSDYNFMKELDKFNITTKIIQSKKECYSRYIKKSLLKNSYELIYNNGKKCIDINKISTLSYNQFMYFLSGLLDGDGLWSGDRIGLCNYNQDLHKIQELCQWNGIFSNFVGKNVLSFKFINLKDLKVLKNKRWNNFENICENIPNTKQQSKHCKYRKIDDKKYRVKISSIESTEDIIEMMDIETSNHSFIANGMETHNCEKFDMIYIVNRIKRILGEEKTKLLSPWRRLDTKTIEVFEEEITIQMPLGVSVLDMFHLYRKFSNTPQESYKLDYICSQELGEKKLDYSEYDSLNELYQKDWPKYVNYNIHDTLLVERLNDKLKLLELVYTMAYDAKVCYVDTLATVRPWDVMIHNFMLDKGLVIPQYKQKEFRPYEGAYVKEPIPGGYKWLVSFDVTSEYPSLILQYNMSPETLLPGKVPGDINVDSMLNGVLNDPEIRNYFVSKNASCSAAGNMFSNKKQGFLPEIVQKVFDDRIKYKNQMLEAKKKLTHIEQEMQKRGLK